MAADAPITERQIFSKPLTLDNLESSAISKDEFWEGHFDDYLRIAQLQPSVAFSAHQRIYHSVVVKGSLEFTFAGEPQVRFNFFDDPFENGLDAIYGLVRPSMRLVNVLKSGASRFGEDRRMILLHGPVGSSKSTIARLMCKGLSSFTKTELGKLYTFSWYIDPNHEALKEIRYSFGLTEEIERNFTTCPLHEDPLKLLPIDVRTAFVNALNGGGLTSNELEFMPDELRPKGKSRGRRPEETIYLEGELCPLCRYIWRSLLRYYKADWKRILKEHVRVERLIFSEVDRIGIGSFHPKDEKNQDSTELSGDIDWSKIKNFGSESDPRSFDFRRGEYFVANRGIMYKEEMLKADKAFRYDDLHASQDHQVKPKGFSVVHLDELIMGGTNNPEYETLRDDEKEEAFRDRISRVDIPYVIKLSDETKIYEKVYRFSAAGKHMSPHVFRIASFFGVISRVENPKEKLSRVQKVKLYDGQFIGEEWNTEEAVKKIMDESGEKEGMQPAISPRYIQDKIGNAVVKDPSSSCVTVFQIFTELEEGLLHHSLFKAQTKRDELKALLNEVRSEYDEMLKEEIEQAVASDESGILELFKNYLINLQAYKRGGPNARVKNPITKLEEPYNERLMREVEEKIGIADREKDQFRTTIYESIANTALEGKTFDYKSNERLYRGLRKKLFDDRKDQIKLSTLHTRVLDQEEQEKIDIIKKNLKERFGYCDVCGTVVLHHVAGIFARGEATKK